MISTETLNTKVEIRIIAAIFFAFAINCKVKN